MKPCYRIHRVGPGRNPTVQHATLKDAEAEALRLAGQHPGETFEILQVLGTARTTEPAIFWNDTVEDPDGGTPDGRRKLPEPQYPTTILPEGFDRWEYRGRGWKPGREASYTIPYFPGSFWTNAVCNRVPDGAPAVEYWEAVKDEPRYRYLEPGERIEEGDEYLVFGSSPGMWLPRRNCVGDWYHPSMMACTRRLIPTPKPTA